MLRKRLEEVIRNFLKEKTAAKKRGVQLTSMETELKDLVKSDDEAEYFIQFSDINKLGINPSSRFETPIGIYAYPLTSDIYQDLLEGHLPFAQERKFLILFKPKNKERVVEFREDDLSDKQFELLVEIVKKYALQNIDYQKYEEEKKFRRDDVLKYNDLYIKNMEKNFGPSSEETIKNIKAKEFIVNHMLNNYELETIDDDGEIKIFDKALFKYLDVVRRKKLPQDKNEYNLYKIKEIEKNSFETSRGATHNSKFWNFTRNIIKQNMKAWGLMFRKIGIEGFVDYGTETIHPNEPIQSVFFGKDFLDVVKVYDNKLTPEKTQIKNVRRMAKMRGDFLKGDIIKLSDEYIAKIRKQIEDVIEKQPEDEKEKIRKDLSRILDPEGQAKIKYVVLNEPSKMYGMTVRELGGDSSGSKMKIPSQNFKNYKLVKRK